MDVTNGTTVSPVTPTVSPAIPSESNFLWMEMIFGLSMFLGCFLSYILPIKLLQRKRGLHHPNDSSQRLNVDFPSVDHHEETTNRILRWCNCFGAGIFVSVCFLGVMPVVHQEFDAFFDMIGMKGAIDYPVAELTTLLGFFLVLFLEEVIHLYQRSSNSNSRHSSTSHPHVLLEASSPATHLHEDDEDDQPKDNRHSNGNFEELNVSSTSGQNHLLDHEYQPLYQPENTVIKPRNGVARPSGHHNHHRHTHSHSHSHSHMMPTHGAGFTFFILMFATSIHSIFEGMALGLIKEPSRAIHIFIGIILHECIVAVALGLNSFRLETPAAGNRHGSASSSSAMMFGLIFSSTIPVGMIIGILVGYTPGSFGRLISAIFQGLAAGTFLHVAFCELIPEELNSQEVHDDHVTDTEEEEIDLHGDHHHHVQESSSLTVEVILRNNFYESKLFRIILIFAGFLFMAVVTLFIDHND